MKSADYGMDAKWQAGEAAAFVAYNRLCAEQAKAVFTWNRNPAGPKPTIAAAAELAALARKQAA